jgi:hypothetical protein
VTRDHGLPDVVPGRYRAAAARRQRARMGSVSPRLLVRRPSPRLEAGELTHLARSPVDPDLALR